MWAGARKASAVGTAVHSTANIGRINRCKMSWGEGVLPFDGEGTAFSNNGWTGRFLKAEKLKHIS